MSRVSEGSWVKVVDPASKSGDPSRSMRTDFCIYFEILQVLFFYVYKLGGIIINQNIYFLSNFAFCVHRIDSLKIIIIILVNNNSGLTKRSRGKITHFLRLLRVPHGGLEALGLTTVTLLTRQEEADMALVGGGIPTVIEHHQPIHAGPAIGTLL